MAPLPSHRPSDVRPTGIEQAGEGPGARTESPRFVVDHVEVAPDPHPLEPERAEPDRFGRKGLIAGEMIVQAGGIWLTVLVPVYPAWLLGAVAGAGHGHGVPDAPRHHGSCPSDVTGQQSLAGVSRPVSGARLSIALRAPCVQPIDQLVAELPEHRQLLLLVATGVRRVRKTPMRALHPSRERRAPLVGSIAHRDHPVPAIADQPDHTRGCPAGLGAGHYFSKRDRGPLAAPPRSKRDDSYPRSRSSVNVHSFIQPSVDSFRHRGRAPFPGAAARTPWPARGC